MVMGCSPTIMNEVWCTSNHLKAEGGDDSAMLPNAVIGG